MKNKTPLFIEPIDPESHQTREVYACYGLAIYYAQCLERTVAMLTAAIKFSFPDGSELKYWDMQIESEFKATFGQLLSGWKRRVKISPDLEKLLEKSLKTRNWLTHHYFWERAMTFMTSKGRTSMIEELQTLSSEFKNSDLRLQKILNHWLKGQGITEEMIEAKFEAMKRETRENND